MVIHSPEKSEAGRGLGNVCVDDILNRLSEEAALMRGHLSANGITGSGPGHPRSPLLCLQHFSCRQSGRPILPLGISLKTVPLEAHPGSPVSAAVSVSCISPPTRLLHYICSSSVSPGWPRKQGFCLHHWQVYPPCLQWILAFGPNKSAVDDWPVTLCLPSLPFFFFSRLHSW